MFICLCDCVSCMRVCLQRPESISLGTVVKGSVSADGVPGAKLGFSGRAVCSLNS